MKHNGLTFRRSRTLGYRQGNPEIDKDLDGRPVPKNYVAIVKIDDCRIYEKDGRLYYDATHARSIPIGYGGTYYGYGEWRKKKHTQNGKWIRNDIGEMVYVLEYYQCTVYLVSDGIVYTHKIKRVENPKVKEIMK
jgi:hypothetical protein